MEGFYGSSSSSKAPKFKSLTGEISPLSTNFVPRSRVHHPYNFPILDPYASDSSNSPNPDSPLFRYLRSTSPADAVAGEASKYRRTMNAGGGSSGGGVSGGFRSPLSAIENIQNSPVFKTPMNVEEDVLVMDGILVGPKGSARMRSSLALSDSSSRASSSPGGSENSIHRSDTCRSWEGSGTCRFGAKCQFAHGKEELRPTRFTNRGKPEAQIRKSNSSGSSSYGTKCRFVHHQVQLVVSSTEAAMALPPTSQTDSCSIKHTASTGINSTTAALSNSDWYPQDDGIQVELPSDSEEKIFSKEKFDAHIETLFYGPPEKKRLKVFSEFCPE